MSLGRERNRSASTPISMSASWSSEHDDDIDISRRGDASASPGRRARTAHRYPRGVPSKRLKLLAAAIAVFGVLGSSANSMLRAPRDAFAASDAVTLNQPGTLHANGAELSWSQYTGPSGASFQDYEVHRSLTAGFTPSAADLLTTIDDQSTTWYTDTSAAPGAAFSYIVVANSSPSNEVRVTLPASGQSTKLLQPGTDGLDTYIGTGTNVISCANHGGSNPLLVGTDAADTWRSLLNFDLGDIPAGSQITSATLSLWQPSTLVVGSTVATYPVTSAWLPGSGDGGCSGDGASWLESQGAGVSWQAPGGDFDTSGAGGSVTTLSGDPAKWHNFDLTSMVQGWVNGDRSNLGVLLKLTDETPVFGKAVGYASSKDANPALRPKLAINYADGSTATAPTVSIVSPQPNSYVRGNSVNVSATAAANGQVARVEFYLDGNLLATSTSAPYSIAWDSTGATNGTHALVAKAYDDAGNFTTSSQVSVSVANYSPPVGRIVFPGYQQVCIRPACRYQDFKAQGVTPVQAEVTNDPNVIIQRIDYFLDGQLLASSVAPPYTIAWNTLDPSHPAYDGWHELSAEVWDSTGLGTWLVPFVFVQVTNTDPTVTDPNGAQHSVPTEFQASVSATSPPQVVTFDPSLTTQATYPVSVTVTNNSPATWSHTSTFLHYRWFSLAAPTLVTDGPAVGLGQDVGAGQSVATTINVSPPTLASGVNIGGYRLQFDVIDSSNTSGGYSFATSPYCTCSVYGVSYTFAGGAPTPGAWFASAGNTPAESSVTVVRATPPTGGFGIQPYYQYVRTPLGAGMEQLTNVGSGNSVVHLQPFNDPGDGLATVVDLTYNSENDQGVGIVGNSWSLAISSLTDLGLKIQTTDSTHITFTGGDGAPHQLDRSVGDQTVYTERAGDHLYGRRLCSDANSCASLSGADPQHLWKNPMWKLTRPDRVSFTYNSYGYPLKVQDRYGNALTYTLEAPAAITSPAAGDYSQISDVTDAKLAKFHLDYFASSDGVATKVIGKVKDIQDHSGHTLAFNYYDDGNLMSLVEKGGTTAASTVPDRTWVFTYTELNGSAAITAQASRYTPIHNQTNNQTDHIYSVIDPIGVATQSGHETVFGYCVVNDNTGCNSGTPSWHLQKVVDRLGNTTRYNYTVDSSTSSSSANDSTRVAAPLNRTTTYTYQGDQNKAQTFLVTKITDPLGQIRDVHWSTDYAVDKLGVPRVGGTAFSSPYTTFTYDDNGYLTDRADPKEVWNPNDVNHTTLTYQHVAVDPQDVSGSNWRPGRSVAHSDELLTKLDANGNTWTFGYANSTIFTSNATDLTAITSIQDPTQDSTHNTQLAYNSDGTLSSSTDALGNQTVFNSYDPSGQPAQITDAVQPVHNVTQIGYDPDGRVQYIQDPRHAACGGPSAPAACKSGTDPRLYRTYFDYDSFHRLGRQSTTLLNGSLQLNWSDTVYDANNNVLTQFSPHFDACQNNPSSPCSGTDVTSGVATNTATYDGMDRPTLLTGPDVEADTVGQRTQYAYDAAGRVCRVLLPIGVQYAGSTAPAT